LTLEKQTLVKMYRKMLLIRSFDSHAKDLVLRGKIPGGMHSYIGEEAVAVGVCEAIREDDYVYGTHRAHGHCIAKGLSVREMMAELFGKKTGYCKGKGGTMHLAYPRLGMLGANGMVGGGLPLSVGAGLSIKLRGTDQVCVSFFGDGAVAQGVFHEALNLASLWRLPVVFVCENNLYSEGTYISRYLSAKCIADFASPYRMPGVSLDGNDVIAVYENAVESVKRAREGEGPTLMECVTYRWEGHQTGDPWWTYRSKEEVEEWKMKCPIKRLRAKLLEEGILSDQEVMKIDMEVEHEIEEAARFAEESPWPDLEDALRDIFASAYY